MSETIHRIDAARHRLHEVQKICADALAQLMELRDAEVLRFEAKQRRIRDGDR